ncbi:MAG TPA: cation-transporting P-type ATPase, partial [Jatrophihabitans sp.]|nr:cation-transporting P-type ATPase [Jatrophihabitans sp.]
MSSTLTVPARPSGARDATTIVVAAATPAAQLLADLETDPVRGLGGAQATDRLAAFGLNAVRVHRVRAWQVLARQFRSAVLVLLLLTGVASYLLGERTESVIIGLILGVSILLGFGNEYRAERSAAALHTSVRH